MSPHRSYPVMYGLHHSTTPNVYYHTNTYSVSHNHARMQVVAAAFIPTVTPGPNINVQPTDIQGAVIQRKRPKYTRSKTGCLTCRRKKVKCDEFKPKCNRCTQGLRECVWPEHVPTRKKPMPKQNPPSPVERTGASSPPTLVDCSEVSCPSKARISGISQAKTPSKIDSGSDTSTVDASTRSMAFPHVVPSQSAGTTSHGVVGVGKPYYTGGHNRYRQQYSAPMPPTYMPYVPYGAVRRADNGPSQSQWSPPQVLAPFDTVEPYLSTNQEGQGVGPSCAYYATR